MDFRRNITDLIPSDLELLAQAESALSLAYAPYSRFRVGAAVLTAMGNVVLGANQENASYPMCMCGERVAIYNTAIQFPHDVVVTVAIRVSAEFSEVKPAPPCGACLQVLSEYEKRQAAPIRLLLKGDSDTVLDIPAVKVVLPAQFDGEFLKR